MLWHMQNALRAGELYSSSADSLNGQPCLHFHMYSISFKMMVADLSMTMAVSEYPVSVMSSMVRFSPMISVKKTCTCISRFKCLLTCVSDTFPVLVGGSD